MWLQAWCGALKSDTAFANWKNDQQATVVATVVVVVVVVVVGVGPH